jgi:hypothetical protein
VGFERELFSQIADQEHRNAAFLAIKLQLLCWLRPDHAFLRGQRWLSRKRVEGGVLIEPQEIVGWAYAYPRSREEGALDFPISWDGCTGVLTIEFHESIERVIVGTGNESRHYPMTQSLSVGAPALDDEFEYWSEVAATANDAYRAIAKAVQRSLKANDLSESPVIAAPGVEPQALPGISDMGCYGDLIRVANGLNCQTLTIWGDFLDPSRIAASGNVLLIGVWNNDVIGLPIRDGVLGNTVQRVDPAGNASSLGKGMLQLAIEEIETNAAEWQTGG